MVQLEMALVDLLIRKVNSLCVSSSSIRRLVGDHTKSRGPLVRVKKVKKTLSGNCVVNFYMVPFGRTHLAFDDSYFVQGNKSMLNYLMVMLGSLMVVSVFGTKSGRLKVL